MSPFPAVPGAATAGPLQSNQEMMSEEDLLQERPADFPRLKDVLRQLGCPAE